MLLCLTCCRLAVDEDTFPSTIVLQGDFEHICETPPFACGRSFQELFEARGDPKTKTDGFLCAHKFALYCATQDLITPPVTKSYNGADDKFGTNLCLR